MGVKRIRKVGETMGRQEKGISEEVLCGEYEAVYRYVLALCHQETEAQDITQETFLKAMKGADRFGGDSSLYTWLCAIAKHEWLNRCKRASREVASNQLEKPDMGPLLEQQALEKDTAMQIHRVLHELKEPYKEVFSLRVFGQLSFSEIGGLFSKTESWARVTYHRARKQISAELRKEGYYEE